MSFKKTVAITGANGFLGSTLATYFHHAGWQVIALTRSQPKQNYIVWRMYDMEKEVERDLLKGVDVLIHAAYIAQGADHADVFTPNINAAKRILAQARTQNVAKSIFISSMSSHSSAESSYGRQKFTIEKLFSGKNEISIRPGLIIGNGGIVRRMADFMRSKHCVPLIGGGTQPLQIIAIGDIGPALEGVIAKNLTGVLTLATAQVYSYKEFYKQLARRLNIRVVLLPIPLSLLFFVVSFIERIGITAGASTDNVLGLKKLTAVDNRKDLATLGIQPIGLIEALQKTEFTAKL